MHGIQTIHSNRNKMNKLNKIYSIIPKKFSNTDSNISPYRNVIIHSHREYKPKKIIYQKIYNDKMPTSNISISNYNKSDIPKNKYLFKTFSLEKKYSLSNKNYRKFIKLKNKENNFSRQNHKSEKISLKLNVNDSYKSDEIENKTDFFRNKINRNKNSSIQYSKTTSSNNNLSYYFPNLFNVPYNRLFSPEKNINTSKFLFKNLKELNYDEEIKNLSLIKKKKTKNISTEEKNNRKPIFIEKVYNFDILKNLRFNFKNSIEKGKYKNFINSFYISRNLQFNNN